MVLFSANFRSEMPSERILRAIFLKFEYILAKKVVHLRRENAHAGVSIRLD